MIEPQETSPYISLCVSVDNGQDLRETHIHKYLWKLDNQSVAEPQGVCPFASVEEAGRHSLLEPQTSPHVSLEAGGL